MLIIVVVKLIPIAYLKWVALVVHKVYLNKDREIEGGHLNIKILRTS